MNYKHNRRAALELGRQLQLTKAQQEREAAQTRYIRKQEEEQALGLMAIAFTLGVVITALIFSIF